MSDDLVKRLRDRDHVGTATTERNFLKSVADRIEELETQLDRVAQDLDNAVFAWDQHQSSGDMMDGWWVSDARTTLAELKGEK